VAIPCISSAGRRRPLRSHGYHESGGRLSGSRYNKLTAWHALQSRLFTFLSEDIVLLYMRCDRTQVHVVNQRLTYGWHDGKLYVQVMPPSEEELSKQAASKMRRKRSVQRLPSKYWLWPNNTRLPPTWNK